MLRLRRIAGARWGLFVRGPLLPAAQAVVGIHAFVDCDVRRLGEASQEARGGAGSKVEPDVLPGLGIVLPPGAELVLSFGDGAGRFVAHVSQGVELVDGRVDLFVEGWLLVAVEGLGVIDFRRGFGNHDGRIRLLGRFGEPHETEEHDDDQAEEDERVTEGGERDQGDSGEQGWSVIREGANREERSLRYQKWRLSTSFSQIS